MASIRRDANTSPIPVTPISPEPGTTGADQKKRPTRKNPARRRSEQAKFSRTQSAESVTIFEDANVIPTVIDHVSLETNAQDQPKPRRKPRKLNIRQGTATTTATVATVTAATTAPSSSSLSPSPKPTPRPILVRKESITEIRPSLAVASRNQNRKQADFALVGPALVTGGLLGCVAGAAVISGVCLWQEASGTGSAILAAQAAKISFDNLTEDVITTLKAGTFSADEALDVLRRSALAYASTIPRGTAYVERIFREIQLVRKERGREVDAVLSETVNRLSQARSQGAAPEKMHEIAWTQLAKLSTFASNTLKDVVDRNPSLKPYKESLRGHPKPRIPTLKYNMVIARKKQNVAG